MLSPRNSWKRAKVQGKVKLAICTWLGPGTPSLLLLPWPSQSQAKPRLQGLENWLMARNWGHNGKKAKWNMADSRAVQWWRLCASNLGDMASIPGQGTKIPHAQSQNIKKKKKKKGRNMDSVQILSWAPQFYFGVICPWIPFLHTSQTTLWVLQPHKGSTQHHSCFLVSWTTPGRRPQAIETKYRFLFFSPASFLLEVP